MIAGIFHAGSGLGNQLFRYVATRVLAEDKGYEWGMMQSGNFKGTSFMNLDMGKNILEWERLKNATVFQWKEKVVKEFTGNESVDIRSYDPEVNFVEDNTIIDGEFQDPRYFEHRLDDIREWLHVEPLEMPDDLCVIGFRGGEYRAIPDLFLPKAYWDEAIAKMREINPSMRFQVHTDDVSLAKEFFPDFECTHEIGLNWRSIRYAKYLILANSSFFILPALLNTDLLHKPIAPKYWSRHNIGVWAMAQNYYKQFHYI